MTSMPIVAEGGGGAGDFCVRVAGVGPAPNGHTVNSGNTDEPLVSSEGGVDVVRGPFDFLPPNSLCLKLGVAGPSPSAVGSGP